ncbi:PIPO, partial [Bean yellow mosaic virus]|uniref:PIPO n=1 Tax=Bean yellow mosaic virus TaxID=12197 RepID=UPI000264F5C8
NLNGGFGGAMARIRIVGTIIFNKAVVASASKVFKLCNPTRRARYKRQVHNLTQVIRGSDKTTVTCSKGSGCPFCRKEN